MTVDTPPETEAPERPFIAYDPSYFASIKGYNLLPLSALLGGVLTVSVFLLIRRSARARARQDWLRSGQVGLAEAVSGDLTLEQLAEDWITLWQTEIAGWMTDPELARMLAAWMSQGAAGWGGAAPGAPSASNSTTPPRTS